MPRWRRTAAVIPVVIATILTQVANATSGSRRRPSEEPITDSLGWRDSRYLHPFLHQTRETEGPPEFDQASASFYAAKGIPVVKPLHLGHLREATQGPTLSLGHSSTQSSAHNLNSQARLSFLPLESSDVQSNSRGASREEDNNREAAHHSAATTYSALASPSSYKDSRSASSEATVPLPVSSPRAQYVSSDEALPRGNPSHDQSRPEAVDLHPPRAKAPSISAEQRASLLDKAGACGSHFYRKQVENFVLHGELSLSALSYLKLLRRNAERCRQGPLSRAGREERLAALEKKAEDYLERHGMTLTEFRAAGMRDLRAKKAAACQRWRQRLKNLKPEDYRRYNNQRSRVDRFRKKNKGLAHHCPNPETHIAATPCDVAANDASTSNAGALGSAKDPMSAQPPGAHHRLPSPAQLKVRQELHRNGLQIQRDARAEFLNGGPLTPTVIKQIKFYQGSVTRGRRQGSDTRKAEYEVRKWQDKVDAWLASHDMTVDEFLRQERTKKLARKAATQRERRLRLLALRHAQHEQSQSSEDADTGTQT